MTDQLDRLKAALADRYKKVLSLPVGLQMVCKHCWRRVLAAAYVYQRPPAPPEALS